MVLSYARISGGLETGQIASLKAQNIEVHQDPRRDTFILVRSHPDLPLDDRLQSTTDLSGFNDALNNEHGDFSSQLGKLVDSETAYIDILLEESSRMVVREFEKDTKGDKVTRYIVTGLALVQRSDGSFTILNESALTDLDPYIQGIGSLLNPRELAVTYDRSSPPIDFSTGRAFWAVESGYSAVFKKVPTRNFWSKDPTEIANSAVLDIEPNPEGLAVVIVYDADAAKREQHKTFMREANYRFIEISPDAIDTDNIVRFPDSPEYDPNRPVFGVKADKIIMGKEEFADIEALQTAKPLFSYLDLIVRGLMIPAPVQGQTNLLKLYVQNTVMPDGRTRLIQNSTFRDTLKNVMQEYGYGQIAAADTLAE